MITAGVIGLGNMGSGIALNLVKGGIPTWGFDVSPKRMSHFVDFGGTPADDVVSVARSCDAVFVMVMNGQQAEDVILGANGLVANMQPGGVIILTATIKPSEAAKLGERMENSGIDLIDSPVSGGYAGAQGGTLTLMASGKSSALIKVDSALQAISKVVHIVGDRPGHGQSVKSCLQSLIGPIFSATFETAVLAAKAGIKGEVLFDVLSSSPAGCGIMRTALANIIDRKFEGTGSHIDTMHKDLGICLGLADELDVPMTTASTAFQLFKAGRSKYPQGDNWVITRVLEEIVGVELHREGEGS